ncbi:MAG: sigma 54-interacting transcriptional regulator [Desulfovibrio sp.]|jgi:Nif-specific regulatory protein|nr:sigma 54-interacting transcriptional regulator [Desulfovibrio sp.]
MPDLQIRSEANELRLLFEVSQALDEASDFSDRLDSALELMAKYTGMMRGTLLLADPASGEIAVEVAYGLKASEQKRGRYKPGEGVTGRVIATGRPMVVPKVSEDPLFLNRTEARDIYKEEISFICVPIMVGGKAVGALSADRLFADSVCLEEDMRLMQVLASLIARAVRIRRDLKAMHAAVVEENRRLQQLLHSSFDAGALVGSSAVMRSMLEEVVQVTSTNATVLIRGESGTGKELVAGIIHANSPRAGRPFVKVNCAALPEGLVESELFGHERGAFTGAVGARKGRFEMAHGGTLFLDEVGDMTPMIQAKLLRAIQEREFERVGGMETMRVDVRLIAATNRDLESMVAKGEFRQDLYYRLSVFPLILPPLRERREDIMALVTHFVDKACAGNKRKVVRISPQATDLLMAYSWPGNIRELENVIERAVILCGLDGVIDAQHLPSWLQSPQAVPSVPSGTVSLDSALSSLEERLIKEALCEAGGNMAKAAARLGVTERIMGLRMKKYDLDYRAFRHSLRQENSLK